MVEALSSPPTDEGNAMNEVCGINNTGPAARRNAPRMTDGAKMEAENEKAAESRIKAQKRTGRRAKKTPPSYVHHIPSTHPSACFAKPHSSGKDGYDPIITSFTTAREHLEILALRVPKRGRASETEKAITTSKSKAKITIASDAGEKTKCTHTSCYETHFGVIFFFLPSTMQAYPDFVQREHDVASSGNSHLICRCQPDDTCDKKP
ncbi:hypothetical protein EDD15DRAFT_439633 [Pisolithus albus]|nr:hypothetical protein EDD15DRAFT_439633 [Pisolithus albus]